MSDALDLKALRHLRSIIGGSTDDLMELVNDFVTALPSQMQDMRRHAANDDLASLRITAHSCKSNARDLGAPELSVLCAAVEKACAERRQTEISDLVARVEVAGQSALDGYARLVPADV